MKHSLLAALLVSASLIAAAPLAAEENDRLKSGSVQAYDGTLGVVRVLGRDFVLSKAAVRQIEDYLAAGPGRTLRNTTIRFEPRRRNGRPYIDSVVIPQDGV